MLGQRCLFVAVLAVHAATSLAFTTSPALARLSGNGPSAFTPLSTKGSLYVAPRRATQLTLPRANIADYGLESRVPEAPAKTKCACGSNKVYADCCQKHHDAGVAPSDPVETIRARYSAFAYALPNFLMASTHPKSKEHKDNKEEWEQDLVDFCQSYRFHRRGERVLGVRIEDTRYLGIGDEASVQFRARMIGPGQKLVTFWERSRLLKSGDQWLYCSGSLLEFEGPLL